MASEMTPGNARATIGVLGAAAIGALAMATVALKPDEGKRNTAYRDVVGIPTICYGHTGPDVRMGQRRSDAQCEQLLTADVEAHLRGVLRCTPGLADRRDQLAAATRLTFNIGVAAYCRSTIARRFNAGDLRGGCEGFIAWRYATVNGRKVEVRGLKLRRERERAACLQGLGA